MSKVKQIASLNDLTPDATNANRHNQRGMSMMEDSLRECGYGDSLTVDREGNVISGNGRVETLQDLKMLDPIVVQSDGTRPIIHQRTDLVIDEEKARKLALYQNRVGQVNLTWDPSVLAALAEDGVKVADLWTEDEWAALFMDDSATPTPPAASTDEKYGVVVECGSAYEEGALMERLQGEGLRCRRVGRA